MDGRRASGGGPFSEDPTRERDNTDGTARTGTGDATAGGQHSPADSDRTASAAETISAPTTCSSNLPPIGSRLGNFRIEEILGEGAFGNVYRGVDVKLHRDVAMKFLKDPLNERGKQLFEREARVIAKLSKHANIIDIYEWGEYENHSYFVMEYMPASVDSVLKKHPQGLPVERTLRIVLDCARALAFAHENKVVHRDVKPANVLLDGEDGPAKVADFGLTRLLDSPETTMFATISGSPPYMSPEQASGAPLDHRTDIFSLGVMLYQLLCGQRPFEGHTSEELMTRIRNNDRKPLRERAPDLPEAVHRLVDLATAHDPDERFQTAQAFAVAIDSVLAGAPAETIVIGAKPSSPMARKAGWMLAGVVAACALFAAWAFVGRPVSLPPELIEAKAKLEAGQPAEAQALYASVLSKKPSLDDARYGLGYAMLQQGRPPDAQSEFEQLSSEPLKNEGLAAVVYTAEGHAARGRIEQLAAKNPTAYLNALIGMAALVAGDAETALARLAPLESARFEFLWQREDCLQALGQAYVREGKYDEASKVFAQLAASERGSMKALAESYQRFLKRQEDAARREEVVNLAKEIEQSMGEDFQEPTPDELWTSRPVTFYLLPLEAGQNRYAVEAGLADILPMLIEDKLYERPPLNLVKRGDLVSEALKEQALSAKLSGEEGKLLLKRFLGARLTIQCSVASIADQNWIKAEVIDNETSEPVRVDRVTLPAEPNPVALAKDIADGIALAVEKQYPLRGKIERDENRVLLNIGQKAGVKKGVAFALASEPDTYRVVPGATAVVDDEPAAEWALVRLEGIEPKDVPDTGLYAFQKDSE